MDGGIIMYRLNEEKMFYDFADGQAVVINFVTGMYYGTDLLGSAILNRITAGCAVEEIIKAVKMLPGCPADMEDRIHSFIRKLEEKEIIVSGPTSPGGSEPMGTETASDGFDLKLEMFAEMSDLLLADPVHDVDIAAGWPFIKGES